MSARARFLFIFTLESRSLFCLFFSKTSLAFYYLYVISYYYFSYNYHFKYII